MIAIFEIRRQNDRMVWTTVGTKGLFHRKSYVMIMCIEMFTVEYGVGSEDVDYGDDGSDGNRLSFPCTQR